MTNLTNVQIVRHLKTIAHLLNCPETRIWDNGSDATICFEAKKGLELAQKINLEEMK